MEEGPEKKSENKEKSALRNLYEYSSLGFQMAAIIGLSAWFGRWLDSKFQTEKSWFSLGFVIFGISLAMYFTLKKINQMNKD